MGTISEKISYLNETKARQKNLINALGGNITNDTPFREYEKELVGVLPKVTGEGTNISLSPTIEYDLEVGSYKGDTTQNTLTGKNLLNPANNKDTWAISFTGQIINSPNRHAQYCNITGGTTYTISRGSVGTATYWYYGFFEEQPAKDSQSISFGDIGNSNLTTTQTAPSNANYLVVFYGGGESTNTMVEKGSSATTYEPYCGGIPSPNPNYPQNIQVVTGTQEIEIYSNLLNPQKVVTDNNSSNIYITQDNANIHFITNADKMKIEPSIKLENQPYTIKLLCKNIDTSMNQFGIRANYTDGTYESLVTIVNTSAGSTRTMVASTNGEKSLDYFSMVHSVSKEAYLIIEGSEIVLGTFTSETIPPYASYQTSTTYTLHLGDLELAKIGDYQDYIYYNNGKWYKYGAIGKVVYTGSNNENFEKLRDYVFNINLSNAIYPTSSELMLLYCNYYTGVPNSATWNNYDYMISNSSYNNKIVFRNIDTKEVSDFKTWLSTHNTIVYYVLVTPSTTEITNETLLSDLNNIKENAMSYSGTTNISTNGNLPVIISARALKGE